MMMEPLISLTIRNPRPYFLPGDVLSCEYQIDAVGENEIVAVEASVLWYTEGKGDEDLGLHFFERRLPGDALDGDLRELRRFETECPNSPLSYDGLLVKIRWCVRVRVFLPRGKEVFFELPFKLGDRERLTAQREDAFDSDDDALDSTGSQPPDAVPSREDEAEAASS